MKTLLHVCCAPCSIMCIESLKQANHDITAFWYNINIHPFTEYRSRRNAVREYMKSIGVPLIERDDYGLREFVRNVAFDIDNRCDFCYFSRINPAAEEAAKGGFEAFTTSLLISPYQNRDKLLKVGYEAQEKYGVRFLPEDFRPYFKEGQERARSLEIYMQKYCGCVFSEEERYRKKKKPKKEEQANAGV